ncbi:MAG TPA: hypothetical protein VL947_02505, partial [Cytophagales bacterium]|nr:hypothetical protein [Cytophagales bacterium]
MNQNTFQLKSRSTNANPLVYGLGLLALLSFAFYCFYTSYYQNSISKLVYGEVLTLLSIGILNYWYAIEYFSLEGEQLIISKGWGIQMQVYNSTEILDYIRIRDHKADKFLFRVRGKVHSMFIHSKDHVQMVAELSRKGRKKGIDLESIYESQIYYNASLYAMIMGLTVFLTALVYKLFIMEIADVELQTIHSRLNRPTQIGQYEVSVGKNKYQTRTYVKFFLEDYCDFEFELKRYFLSSEPEAVLQNINNGDSVVITTTRAYHERLVHSSILNSNLKEIVDFYRIPVYGLSHKGHT